MDAAVRVDDAWRAWFGEQGVEPVVLTYEELVADRERALQRLLRALDIAVPVAFAFRRGRFVRRNRSRRQSDAATEELVERFRQDAASRS